MRAQLFEFHQELNNASNPSVQSSDIILLHCDMFPYTGKNIINLHIQEQTMINVAAGIAYTGKPVIIYGVLGFVFLKALEQIKFSILDFSAKYAPIIMCNAGYTGCYEMFGKGHVFKEELDLCRVYGIEYFVPNKENFKDLIKDCLKTNGFKYILIY
ncbi:hypothetical protein AADV15_000813 [Campylobacter coli]